MKVKELKNILNSRNDLDNCIVKIDLVDDGGGTCVPLEEVECMLRFIDSYDGAVIYLVGCVNEEDRKTRDKDAPYTEVQIYREEE